MELEEKELVEIIEEVADKFLIARFNELGMRATGEWEENINVIGDSTSATIRGREYTESLVHGVPPGTTPPVSKLEIWAKAKLGLSGRQATSAAFAISKKIEQEGTTWYKQGGTDLLEILESDEVIEYINNRVSDKLTVRVQNFLVRELKELDNG